MLIIDRHDGQPPQVLPLDFSNRMVDVRVCGSCTRDVWVSGVYDGCEFSTCAEHKITGT